MSPSPWLASILTLYPDAFPGTLNIGPVGRGLREGYWNLETINIRDFATDPHRSVDDTPYGGGPGMVLRADIADRALTSIRPNSRPAYYLSPRGKPITQAWLQEQTQTPGIILLCGRFEGIDERLLQHHKLEEISVGDYVLSGGEPAALTVLDGIARLLPGVLGNQTSDQEESFSYGLLEHPQYTRPATWQGVDVPEVLLSGNHGAINAFRLAQSERLTMERRPDLWSDYLGKNNSTSDKL